MADDDDHLNGCMIALMPTAADAARLAVSGGEAAADLHVTLFFLGGDASAWSPDQRTDLLYCLGLMLQPYDLEPITANVFGVAHWNGNSPTPAWVWNVGEGAADDASMDPDMGLVQARYAAGDALASMHQPPDIPAQHCPWVPHICAAYSPDLTLVRTLEKRLGPVTFDRLRVSFGSEDHDIPLEQPEEPGEAVTAGLLRRQLKAHEQHVNFAEQDRQWQQAVAVTTQRLHTELGEWRQQIREQLAKGPDDPAVLSSLHVDTRAAAGVLAEQMHALAEQAGRSVQREAESQGVTVPEWRIPDGIDDAVTAALGGKELVSGMSRMTSDLMASNMVQSAKRYALGLLTRRKPGDDIAREVDRKLQDSQSGAVQAPVKQAMAAAQTLGRNTVLLAAPPAQTYTASEVLDQNTCKPCIAVDGTQYDSIKSAIAAYPIMGYGDCVGSAHGNACRGFIVADWTPPDDGSAETASAAILRAGDPEEENVTTTTEALAKGKPSKGTPADKRLKENKEKMAGTVFADPGHYDLPVEQLAWDGSASRFTDAQYRTAAAACDPGTGSAKELCFLPHHEPGGALNADGVHAAANRVSSLTGHSPEAVARAKAHLRGHYSTLGEKPPDSLAATALEAHAFGLEDGYEEIVFAQSAAAPPATGQAPEFTGDTVPWRGPLTVEGVETGDGREFDNGALTWADLPLPLRWNRVDSHGGEARTEAVNVGRIDNIWREDSGLIMGEGVLDLSTDDGQTARNKIAGKMLRGVSVDVDSIKDADMELIWPDSDGDSDEGDIFAQLFGAPEKVVFHKGRIRAATLVDIPAFAEAYIALIGEDGAVTAGGEPIGALRETRAARLRSASVQYVPERAPAEWFANPDLSVPTGITVTPEGRVYGHAALWGTCHVGQAGLCVTPPQEDQHPYFMTGAVWAADGTMVSVGQITLGTGHADIQAGHRAAVEHYDNTGSAVADVAVGNDAHGIWVAGSVRPGTSPERIHELRASGQVSGDWRNIGGKLRLVGLLAVNVPGFPVPKVRAKYTGGQQLALVAAGVPSLSEGLTEDDLDQLAYARIMGKLGQRVHRQE